MDEARISVAMATYNGERFLQEQLDSLARQTILPLELVACDDGSTDRTLAILRRFAASAPFVVRIYQNKTRLGFGFNFLQAISHCTGELVALCDQDDVWSEQKLKICADVMRDPHVALVSHSARVFSAQPLPRRWRNPDHRACVWTQCRDIPVRSWAILGFSVVFRRAVLERAPVPEYNDNLSSGCAHDVWVTIAALSCGNVVFLPDELVLHRLHEGNVTFRLSAGQRRLAPDPSRLERGAADNASLAAFLRYAASSYDGPARGCFYEYIRQITHIGRLCSERAQLHRACGHRVTAIKMLAGMCGKKNYAPRSLGAKALVRDALLAALWTAREPLRRHAVMANEKRIVQLDGLRAIAVLMVFFSHAYRSQVLWAGVDLFFVLSGFLITGILLERRGQIKLGDYLTSFYQRRARRILPPYLLFLVLVSLLFGVGWMRHWYLFLFFMNTGAFEALIGLYPIGILWSLAVEEQFYAVWPFAVRWLDERALAWLSASLLVVAPLLRWIATAFLHGHWNIFSSTPFRMDLLAAGALIAIAWRNHRATVETVGRRYGVPIVVFAATILLLLAWYPWFQPTAGTVLVNVWLYELSLIGSVGALLWALSGRAVSILKLPPMAYLGRISYTFYLVHPAAIQISRQYLQHHSAPIAFAGSFLFSALSWHWMERPILAAKPGFPAIFSAPLKTAPGG